jgi:hypothetical protein
MTVLGMTFEISINEDQRDVDCRFSEVESFSSVLFPYLKPYPDLSRILHINQTRTRALEGPTWQVVVINAKLKMKEA